MCFLKFRFYLKNKNVLICTTEIITAHVYCPIDCKVPGNPSNGIVKLAVGGVTTYGATASVCCNAGYELIGDDYLRCRADGTWSSLPSCAFKGHVLVYTII